VLHPRTPMQKQMPAGPRYEASATQINTAQGQKKKNQRKLVRKRNGEWNPWPLRLFGLEKNGLEGVNGSCKGRHFGKQ